MAMDSKISVCPVYTVKLTYSLLHIKLLPLCAFAMHEEVKKRCCISLAEDWFSLSESAALFSDIRYHFTLGSWLTFTLTAWGMEL